MNLDDPNAFSRLDSSRAYQQICQTKEELLAGWEFGSIQSIPDLAQIQQVVIFGMGNSALAGELVAAYADPESPVAVHVYQQLPVAKWMSGSSTLAIGLSDSGNTPEIISACEQTHQRGCMGLVITQGGELAGVAAANNLPIWHYSRPGLLLSPVPFLFGALLALFLRSGWLSLAADEIISVKDVLDSMLERNGKEVPAALNPAKRLAGQLVGCSVVIVGSGYLVPVAQSWKVHINTLAKSLAQFESLPDLLNSSLIGSFNPTDNLHRTMVLFLREMDDAPDTNLQSDLVRQFFMLQGISTDFINARGTTRLAHIWSLLLFGNLVAYYLAMAYDIDPSSEEIVAEFNEALEQRRSNFHQPGAQRES